MRADNSLTEKRVYEFGSFRLETVERVLERDGRALSVAPKALDVLIVLVENRGRIVEREDLIRKVWPETFVEDNNLAFNISVLRKLLGESVASPQYIETVPKRGYRFIASAAEVPNGRPAPSDAIPAASTSVPTPGGRSRWWFPAAALFTLAAAGILASRFHRVAKLTDRDNIVPRRFRK